MLSDDRPVSEVHDTRFLTRISYMLIAAAASAFQSPRFCAGRMPTTVASPAMTAPVAWPMVAVEMDADAVSDVVLYQVASAAEYAIRERGHFALAIPGGSILKMLAKGNPPEWASKATIVYVNHKCVSMDDATLATHAKASALFLDEWEGVTPIVMDGSADAAAEALSYEEKLKALPESVLPRNADGLVSPARASPVHDSCMRRGDEPLPSPVPCVSCGPPSPTSLHAHLRAPSLPLSCSSHHILLIPSQPVFDMMLIGVGDDGHIGSLYPGREEVLDTSGRWVLPVEMKVPGSITLSLPVMAAAERVLVAACGVSDKYPLGKSEAMAKAIEDEDETLSLSQQLGFARARTGSLTRPRAPP